MPFISVGDEAVSFIKNNKELLVEKFITNFSCKPVDRPFTIFMAGSPGAGKTEFSKRLIEQIGESFIRIDADEVKDVIPYYNGKNAADVQFASIIGVEKLFDHALKKKYEIIVDGTMASYKTAKDNIERCLNKKRIVIIFYIYQDPKIAWYFTKAREKLEGRNISKEVFINDFFLARENVNKLKLDFGNKIMVYYVQKDYKHDIQKFKINIENIDKHLKMRYTRESLAEILQYDV